MSYISHKFNLHVIYSIGFDLDKSFPDRYINLIQHSMYITVSCVIDICAYDRRGLSRVNMKLKTKYALNCN